MSNTYTARPTYTNNRGRGRASSTVPTPVNRHISPTRGRGNTNTPARPGRGGYLATPVRGIHATRGRTMNQPPGNHLDAGLDNQLPSASQQPEPIQDRTEMRGSYTVIRPNEEKRNAIQSKARREEEEYAAYKNSKKIQSVSYVGTVGGDAVRQDDVRRKTQQQHNRKQFDVRQKSQQYKAEQKAREDAEYNKKKSEQRKKSEENERRQVTRDEDLHEEHRRVNNAFLDRLEKQTQEAKSKKILSSTAAKSYRQDVDEESEDPQHSLGGSTEDNYPEGATSFQSGHHMTASSRPQGSRTNALTQLIQAYPTYQPEVLCQILDSCDNNLDQAFNLLSIQ